jgi:hypothetical protein
VRNCLDGGAGPTSQSAKYLVYKLPPESVLVGTECVICLEEFVKGGCHVPIVDHVVSDAALFMQTLWWRALVAFAASITVRDKRS